MNLILFRHGEATDNVKKLISDKEIYWSILTESGKQIVLDSISILPNFINKIYVSPFPRTIQTASYIFEKHPETQVIIESRLREISYGKYSHCKNNEELDNIRELQKNDNYFIRFGEYGENRYDIEKRLCDFLKEIESNDLNSTIVIVTHGSISSYIKRILNVKSSHLQMGKFEIINNVDFEPLIEKIQKLNELVGN